MGDSSCHICRRWRVGLRSDFAGGPVFCGLCRNLRSIGNLIGSEAFVEEDGPVIWRSILNLEDHVRDLERQRRREEEDKEEERRRGQKETLLEEQRLQNTRGQKQAPNTLHYPKSPRSVCSGEYTYTEGSEEEEPKEVDCELLQTSAKAAPKKPPTPPAARRAKEERVQRKPEDKAKKPRKGGGQKRKD